jgi:hypothetical protein
MSVFYVYAYIRSSDHTPYYIGKGKGQRALYGRHGVSIPKDRTKIVFLETNLTDIGACAIERRMIAWYGRKDLGTGILYNRTDGGESTHGMKLSPEHRLALIRSNIGRICSKETRTKQSLAAVGRNLDYLQTDVVKEKRAEKLRGIKLAPKTCIHCGVTGAGGAMNRFHFDNCKSKVC